MVADGLVIGSAGKTGIRALHLGVLRLMTDFTKEL